MLKAAEAKGDHAGRLLARAETRLQRAFTAWQRYRMRVRNAERRRSSLTEQIAKIKREAKEQREREQAQEDVPY